MDQTAFAEAVNRYINEYVRFGDAKAGLVLTMVTILGAAVGVAAQDIVSKMYELNAIFGFTIAVCVACAVCVAATLFHAARALQPRVDPAGRSLSSIRDIASMPPAQYAAEVAALGPTDIAEQYAYHNVTLSRIAVAKFNAIADAISWFRWALGFALAAMVMYAACAADARGRESRNGESKSADSGVLQKTGTATPAAVGRARTARKGGQ